MNHVASEAELVVEVEPYAAELNSHPMPSVASGMGPEFFYKNLAEVFLTARCSVCDSRKLFLSVQAIGSEFSEDWTEVNLVPAVIALKTLETITNALQLQQ